MADADSTQDAKRQAKLEYHRAYYRANRERLLAQCKAYRLAHAEEKRQRDKKYYLKTKAKRRAYSKTETARSSRKKYRESHREELRLRHFAWRQKNRHHLRAYKKRRYALPHVALMKRIRDRTRDCLRKTATKKNNKTLAMLGCSKEQLAAWIESQFTDGMSWDVFSRIDIDHIIPLSAFDLKDEEQQQAAFHYTNLRPMWSIENKRKSNKVKGQNLFGFAYAAKIARGMNKQKRHNRRADGPRQHGDNQPRSVSC